MRATVHIRCDAGTELGMGHLVRCISLAHMISRYFRIRFILQETDSAAYDWILGNGFAYLTIPRNHDFDADAVQLNSALKTSAQIGDLVVLDGYHFQSSYQQTIRDEGYRVVAIDDLHNWHHVADALINHAPGIFADNYDTEKYTRLLLGSSYALLRPEILRASQQVREIKPVESVLISMGAADTHNRTLFFAEILAEHFPKLHIHLLVSSINPHLNELHHFAENHSTTASLLINLDTSELVNQLRTVDAVICPASSISLEACALGCSIISGYTAENQLGILAGLTEAGAAISLGNFQTLDKESARQDIASFLSDLSIRLAQRENQRVLIDGLSGHRIAMNFLEISRAITCRAATPEDAMQLFDWANDLVVRANSFQQDPIPWNSHIAWYTQALNSPTISILIYEVGQAAAAQIRLNQEGATATISFSVDSEFRGKGIGTWLLQHICLHTKLKNTSIYVLQGWVKRENAASMRAFASTGFSIAEELEDRVLFKLQLDSL